MDGAHETFDDTEFVIDDLGKRCEAIGSARRVGDLSGWSQNHIFSKIGINAYDGVLGVVSVEVDTADEHWCISRRCGDNNLLGPTLQVSRSPRKKA